MNNYFLVKVRYEKKQGVFFLVQARTIEEARNTIVDAMKKTMIDYDMVEIEETKLMDLKKLTIPAVMHRFISQPIEIEKLMKEKLEHRMINDDFGWTGEWRMSAKDVLDVIIDLQNGA